MKLSLTIFLFFTLVANSQTQKPDILADNMIKYYDNGWYRVDLFNKPFSAVFYDDFNFHTDYSRGQIPYSPYTPYSKESSNKFWGLREYNSEKNSSSCKIEENRLKIRLYEKGRSFIHLKYCPMTFSLDNYFDIILKVDKKSTSLFNGIILGDNRLVNNNLSITFAKYEKVKQLVYEKFVDGIVTKHDVVKDIYVDQNADNELRVKSSEREIIVYINGYEVYKADKTDLDKYDTFGLIVGGNEQLNEGIFKEVFINFYKDLVPKDKKSNIIKLKKANGVFSVPVELNEVLKIDFIFDSGASDVSISPEVALTLLRTGTIGKDDWLQGAYYKFADGSIARSKRFILKSLKIGDKIIKNVTCSISNSIDAPMLLGQSVLGKFGKYTFDNLKQVLILE